MGTRVKRVGRAENWEVEWELGDHIAFRRQAIPRMGFCI